MPTTITRQPVANSTTYIDQLGVLQGLTRISGESSFAFAERVRRAGQLDRSASYQGLMNEIGLQFGFELSQSIALTGPASMTVTVDLAGVHLATPLSPLVTAPLAIIDVDNFWAWRKLSDVAADINRVIGLSATLLTPDAPAFTLVQQSNNVLVVAEAISGQTVCLANTGFLAGTESFNQPVPTYTVSGSILTFSAPLPSGTQITYRFLSSPYSLLTCPVFLMSLLDPNFAQLAVGPTGQLVYQAQEMMAELLTADGSYWTK